MARGWAAAVAPVAVLAGTLALTGSVRGWLERRAILDRPVERSSHAVPVPRGGGLAVMPVLLAGGLVLVWAGPTPNGTAATLSLAALLALVSWRDDLGGLPVGLRLLAHAVAALAGVAMLPNGAVFQGFLPPL